MIKWKALASSALILALPGCGPQAQPKQEQSAEAPRARPKVQLPACPFQNISDWHASIENGRILVNGKVDLMMAGFKPSLAPRPTASAGAIAFDLSLQPEQGAVVEERARYEGPASGAPRKAEIHCGGTVLQAIEIVHVG